MKYSFRLLMLLLSLFIMAGLSACKSKTQTYESDGGKVEVNSEGEKADITIKNKDGETFKMTVNKGELPNGWPSEIPVISGGNIIFSQTESKSNMQQVSIETDSSMADALNYYTEKLNAGGWGIENTMNMPQMNMITAKKSDRELMLQIADAGGKTHVQIIIK